MVNTVHPEHGTRLPTSNNYNKLQAWALEHTRQMGTEANYPRREENAEARQRGDYVKETNRSTRNMWELDKAVRDGVMDQDRADAIMKDQRAKDAALLKATREQLDRQKTEARDLDAAHKQAKADLKADLKTQINRAKADVLETYRPLFRALKQQHAKAKEVFDALEDKLFGRMSNAASVLRQELREEPSSALSRSFGIVMRAGDRKAALERIQARETAQLRAAEKAQLQEKTEALKAAHVEKLAEQRSAFLEAKADTESGPCARGGG